MPSELPITVLRLKEPTHSKIRKLSEINNKKMNQYITTIIEEHIATYEHQHGPIVLPAAPQGTDSADEHS